MEGPPGGQVTQATAVIVVIRLPLYKSLGSLTSDFFLSNLPCKLTYPCSN